MLKLESNGAKAPFLSIDKNKGQKCHIYTQVQTPKFRATCLLNIQNFTLRSM